jgi:PAS domain S-box-containing protein
MIDMEKGSPTYQELGKKVLAFEDIIGEHKGTASDNNSILNTEEYKSIIELSIAGILISDCHGKIISWNNALEDLTGIKQAEAIGRYVWEVQYQLSPDEFRTPEFTNNLKKNLVGIINESAYWQRQVFEQKIRTKGGNEIVVEVSAFVTASHDGNLLVAALRDISTQKSAERTIAIQNEALSKLNQFSIELSKMTLEDSMETIITKRLKEFTGAIGVIFSEFNPESRTMTPKHIELDSALLEKIVNLLDSHVHKIHAVVSDYMYHELTNYTVRVCNSLSELSFWPVPPAVGMAIQALLSAEKFIEVSYMTDGKLYGTSLLALGQQKIDIPMEVLENFVSLSAASLRRKRAEEALGKSEEKLRTITENAADIIMELDHNGTILYTSRVLPGYRREDVVGKNFCDWTATEYHSTMLGALEDVFKKAQPQTYQSKALGVNREIRWFQSHISPVVIGDEVKNAVLILSDITERKLAEEALRESEENYRVIAQSSIDVIFVIDRFGKQLFLNNSIERILGYKVEEGVGRSIMEFLPKDCISALQSQLDNIFRLKQIGNFTTQMYHKDGYLIDVEMNLKLVKLKGEFVGQGTIRDISAKKRAEEELKNSLERNRALLGANPDLMFVFDSNCKIVDFHSESHDQLVVKPEEFLGKLVEEILPHEVVVITREKVGAVLATGNSDYATYELKIGDDLKFFESRYVPCGTREVLSIVRDITERRSSEESLNVAVESYMDIFNSVSEAIYLLDKSGTFLDVNKGAETMYGYTKQEFIGQSPFTIAAPDKNNLDEIRSILSKVFETGQSSYFVFWGERKNGEVFPKEVFVNKGKYFGQEVLIATARDITEKNQVEERFRKKNEELQKINAEKDKFFSIIAHDLRSPFTAFLGFTQLMVQDLPSLRLDNIQEIALLMRDSATNLHRLLENLLQWSRLQRGMIAFNPKKFQLQPKIKSCLQSVMEIANKKGVEINFSIPDDVTVFADYNMFESVISNLTSNAVKFTNKGGKVLISARNTAEKNVEISIKDTGIGLSREILGKLFHLDEYVSRPGTEGEPSTGLGLILCKDFIDRHNGKIWAESLEGMGSTFYFTLPVKE